MKKLTHKFVDCIPRPLEEGVLYVSLRFRVVSHNCCCGCGNEVVINLSPKGWQLTYDGENITLYPSIGNWSLPCQSHYWITHNMVEWATSWSDTRIRKARERDGFPDQEPAKPRKKKSRSGKLGVVRKIIDRIRPADEEPPTTNNERSTVQ